MDFRTAVALERLGLLEPEHIPEMACRAIDLGFRFDCLFELSEYLTLKPHMSDIHHLFLQALKDLRIAIPEEHEIVMLVAYHFAQSIVNGTETPFHGAKKIWAILRHGQHPERLNVFIGLASEYEDYFDRENLEYYGADRCRQIQQEIAISILEEAQRLLDSCST